MLLTKARSCCSYDKTFGRLFLLLFLGKFPCPTDRFIDTKPVDPLLAPIKNENNLFITCKRLNVGTINPADLKPSKMCAMDTDDMSNLRGRVCQLNYNCSGMLEPFPMAGLPKHVPFLKAPLSLRVGQTVRFRIVSRGDDVQAVGISLESDVQHHQEREMPKSNDLNTSSTLGNTVEKPKSLDSGDVMCLVPAQCHSRCFLRRMSQFRNSSQTEQVQVVIEAERSLEKLLGQSALDGDAICRLARKCASWLHPPVLKSANPQRQSDHKSARGTEDQVHLQERIRKILIEALNHLDLQDPSTFEAMKAALFYLASLCHHLDEKCGFSPTTPTRKQWHELKSLLEDSGLKSLENQSEPGPLTSRNRNKQDQMKETTDTVRREHRGDNFRGHVAACLEPSARIKALSTVFQGSPVQLMCSECPFTVTSSWYTQNPKTSRRSLLVPEKGHKTCRQKLKKRCYWKSLDNGPVVRCNVSYLQYCSHNRLLGNCASCGGYKMCTHAKRKQDCKECKHLIRRQVQKDAYSFKA